MRQLNGIRGEHKQLEERYFTILIPNLILDKLLNYDVDKLLNYVVDKLLNYVVNLRSYN
jgi:hypothetical protein